MPFGTTNTSTEPDTPRWYACYTRARHEKKVDAFLAERGFDTWLPVLEQEREWSDRVKKVEMPVFPSYVFARFPASRIHDILVAPGVSTVVRNGGRPTPIPEEELENVRRVVRALSESGDEIESVPYLEEGRKVRVVDGPFKGVTGVVAERRGRKRVLVGLEAIRQGLEVDVPMAYVEPMRE